MALSTAEAEYIFGAEAGREMVWLKRLVEEIVGDIPLPELRIDNQSAMKLMTNPVMHQSTKHIEVRHHFVRELVSENVLKPVFVGTNDQLADALTKALPGPAHRRFCEEIKLVKRE